MLNLRGLLSLSLVSMLVGLSASAQPTAEVGKRAFLKIAVPADAKVEVDGIVISQTGPVRLLASPPIVDLTRKYAYSIKVTWTVDGKPVSKTVEVEIVPGVEKEVDLTVKAPEVKKEEPKKVEPKKEEPRKVEPKKEEMKKEEPKKVEPAPKPPEVKKEEPKKVEPAPKKEEPKKEEPRKVEPAPRPPEPKPPEVKKEEPKKPEVAPKPPEVKKVDPAPKPPEPKPPEPKPPEVKKQNQIAFAGHRAARRRFRKPYSTRPSRTG